MEFDGAALIAAGIIFLLRVASAAVITLRILLMARGAESWATALAFIEALLYVVAFGLVVSDLTNIPIVMGYCLGFATGTFVGMRLERRLAMGIFTLRIISQSGASAIAESLRGDGLGATLSWGEGRDGTVGIVQSVVPRKLVPRVHSLARSIDPNAFVVADEARAVTSGWLPAPIGLRSR